MNNIINCNKCKTDKPKEEFNKRKNQGRYKTCKQCVKIYDAERYKNKKPSEEIKARSRVCEEYKTRLIRLFINFIKFTNKCCFCKEDDWLCIDFHHVKDKIKPVSHLITQAAIKKVASELKKCVCVCANCHRKLHAGRIKIENCQTINIDEEEFERYVNFVEKLIQDELKTTDKKFLLAIFKTWYL